MLRNRKVSESFRTRRATDAERWEKEKAQLTTSLMEKDTELTRLQRMNLIAELATERGLPKSFWKRVSGDSEEDIAEDIDSIVHDLNLGKPEEKAGSSEDTPKKKPVPKKVYGGGGETKTLNLTSRKSWQPFLADPKRDQDNPPFLCKDLTYNHGSCVY